jgi:hypothetical protein
LLSWDCSLGIGLQDSPPGLFSWDCSPAIALLGLLSWDCSPRFLSWIALVRCSPGLLSWDCSLGLLSLDCLRCFAFNPNIIPLFVV